MRDMLSVILRIILGIVAFFIIIIVFVFNYETGEDKGKIRKDEDRIVEYIKEKVELTDNEELRKIEFKEYEKNSSTGTWKFYVVLNDRVDVAITLWGLGGRIYIDRFTEGTMKVLDDDSKKKSNDNDIEVVYGN
ncbi:hypothetical protein O3797_06020 [Gemella sanguinis]|jgi:hypothetical protein|uniref:hypothetical protein n=1 Tax=Gemella sanguinis TaxID=84135 RepID=UPI000807695C|nr:hypothetical protein [Gemella sanguinis]